jgi:hypothetical protein
MKDKTIVQFSSELEMLGFLKSNGTACRFVSMTCRTPVVKMRVGNPFHTIKGGKVIGEVGLWKVARKIGIINANYNMAVRKRIAEKLGVELPEVEYTNGEVWYQHLLTKDGKALPVVEHKDEAKRQETGFSLQYYPHKSTSAYCNGKFEVVDEATVKPYLYAETERPDFKPCVIAVKLRHIHQLKCSGIVVEMGDFEEAAALLAE